MKGKAVRPNQTKPFRTSLHFNGVVYPCVPHITMKQFLKKWLLPKYLASIYTNRWVLTFGGIFLGGIVGLGFFSAIELYLYKIFGPGIFQLMTLPDAAIVLATAGGLIGFWISQIQAARKWYKDQEIVETPAPVIVSEIPNLEPLAFDANKGILTYHGMQCKIPEKTYQHTICAALFERPGVHMDEKDILKVIDWDRDKADSERLVQDAVYAISAKAKAAFGIEKALVWKSLTAWVNDEYLS